MALEKQTLRTLPRLMNGNLLSSLVTFLRKRLVRSQTSHLTELLCTIDEVSSVVLKERICTDVLSVRMLFG